jgi:hypothetical protein
MHLVDTRHYLTSTDMLCIACARHVAEPSIVVRLQIRCTPALVTILKAEKTREGHRTAKFKAHSRRHLLLILLGHGFVVKRFCMLPLVFVAPNLEMASAQALLIRALVERHRWLELVCIGLADICSQRKLSDDAIIGRSIRQYHMNSMRSMPRS